MPFPTGLLHKVSIAPETTPGTKATTGYVALHPIRSGIKPMHGRKPRPGRAGRGIVQHHDTLPMFAQGPLTVGACLTETVITEVLQLLGNISAGVFTFGDGSAPDTATASIRVDFGGIEYAFTGCQINAATLNLPHDDFGTMVLDVIGMGVEKETSPSDPTNPADNLILGPSDYDTLTVGGTAFGHKGLVLTMNSPHSGADRFVAGAGNIRQPVRVAQSSATIAIGGEMDDTTGYDLVSMLDNLISGTDEGAVAVETDLISGGGATTIGDFPDAGAGIQDTTLTLQLDTLTMDLL